MRCLLCVCIAWIGLTGSAAAQDFKSSEAKAAEEKFQQSLKTAQDAYIEDLESAAKSALAADNLDEAVLIKETIEDLKSQQKGDRGDPVVQLRRRLRNTAWTFNRPGKPETIRFLSHNRVQKVAGNRMAEGVWESLEKTVAIAKFNENLFIFVFDENVRAFRVTAFGPVKTDYTVGKRIR